MVCAKKESDIEKLGRVLYVEAPFDAALDALKSKNGKIITMSDLAYSRMQYDARHSLSQNGSYVREGSLLVPNAYNNRIWLRESLVLQNPSIAVNAHGKGNEYLLSEDFNVDSHLEKIGKDNYFVVSDTTPVPTDRFGEDSRMVWAFGDVASEYGKFLNDAGINNLSIWMYNDKHINSQKGPFANQLWLHGLGDDSDIDGSSRFLYDDDRVRGVSRIVGADAPKNPVVKTYTSKDVYKIVNSTLRNVGITGDIRKTIVSDLEKRLK